MQPRLLCERSHAATERTDVWLVCVEAQNLHFVGGEDLASNAIYPQIDKCRALLGHARRSRWKVAHVHRRRSAGPQGAVDPELRPIDGLAPLPSEPVYIRSATRSLALSYDPFWRDAAAWAPRQILLMGHISARGMVELASTISDMPVEVAVIEDAVWRWSPESQFGEDCLPLSTLKRLQATQGELRGSRTFAADRCDPANAP